MEPETDLLGDDVENQVKSKAPPRYTATFERFWDAYPRRVSKSLAFQRWQEQGCEQLAEHIIAHTNRRAREDATWLGAKKFIPHPSVWLNNRRWEDEYETIDETRKESDDPDKSYAAQIYRIGADVGFTQRNDETQSQYFQRIEAWNKDRLRQYDETVGVDKPKESYWRRRATILAMFPKKRIVSYGDFLPTIKKRVSKIVDDFESMESDGFRNQSNPDDQQALIDAIDIVVLKTLKEMRAARK